MYAILDRRCLFGDLSIKIRFVVYNYLQFVKVLKDSFFYEVLVVFFLDLKTISINKLTLRFDFVIS